MKNYDWKKHASAVMADEDVERAFADQAFGMVGQRASKLFQAPYFLGFEMVFSNEDKTRLVGIFAFRANNDLIYAPVFFLNGQIKGQELLYRVKQKMFVPLNEEWVTYLIEKDTPDPGVAIKRNRVNKLLTGVDMTPMIFPRRSKHASFGEPNQGADFYMGGVPPLPAGTPKAQPPTAQWNPAADPALMDQQPVGSTGNTALGSSMGGTVDSMVNNQLHGSDQAPPAPTTPEYDPTYPALNVWGGGGIQDYMQTYGLDEARAKQHLAQNYTSQVPGGGTAIRPNVVAPPAAPATQPAPTQPRRSFTPDMLASFRKQHGSAFDANSRMDRSKMDALMGKTASLHLNLFDGVIEDFCPKVASFAPTGLLRQFLLENPPKYANAVAEAVKSSYDFAEALMRMAGGELEKALPAEAFHAKKVASAPVLPKIAFHFGGVKNANIKTASAMEMTAKLGFTVEDNRDKDEISTVYAEDTSAYESVTTPGLYEIPLADGSSGQAIVAHRESLEGLPSANCGSGYPAKPVCADGPKGLAVLFTKPKVTLQWLPTDKVLGKAVVDSDSKKFADDLGKESASEGQAYVIFDRTKGALSDPFYVLAKRDKEGGTTALVVTGIDNQDISRYSVREILVNKDAPECDFNDGIIDGEARFIQLDTEEIPQGENDVNWNSGATSYSIDGSNKTIPKRRLVASPTILPGKLTIEALLGVGMKFVKVHLRDDSKLLVEVTGKKMASTYLPETAIALLMTTAGMHADAAIELVKTAQAKRRVGVIFEPAVKSASAVTRIVDKPDFTPDYDAYFATAREEPRTYALATETDQPPIREIPHNETYDPALGGQGNVDRDVDDDRLAETDVLTKDPTQIAQMQKAKNTPFVFEHGVVGSLVKTFDAASQVEKYLPALETALDRLGRLVFLIYWKPQDLEKAYGSDDMADLESELTSNFKSYGTLVLNLLKRSKSNTNGAPALQ